MKFKVSIESVKTVNELKNSWQKADYIKLLKAFDLYDENITDENELIELLFLAISDSSPEEAAEIILTYKLSGELSENQISTIAHDMQEDKISEEYPVISLHNQLFNINQLLYKAYNGTFPNIKATIIDFELIPVNHQEEGITKEIVVKALQGGLAENNLIHRLFNDHLDGKCPFDEAESILWELNDLGQNKFQVVTSDYWISKEDFVSSEFEISIKEFEENLEED